MPHIIEDITFLREAIDGRHLAVVTVDRVKRDGAAYVQSHGTTPNWDLWRATVEMNEEPRIVSAVGADPGEALNNLRDRLASRARQAANKAAEDHRKALADAERTHGARLAKLNAAVAATVAPTAPEAE